jgi:hypothetical protein
MFVSISKVSWMSLRLFEKSQRGRAGGVDILLIGGVIYKEGEGEGGKGE